MASALSVFCRWVRCAQWYVYLEWVHWKSNAYKSVEQDFLVFWWFRAPCCNYHRTLCRASTSKKHSSSRCRYLDFQFYLAPDFSRLRRLDFYMAETQLSLSILGAPPWWSVLILGVFESIQTSLCPRSLSDSVQAPGQGTLFAWDDISREKLARSTS